MKSEKNKVAEDHLLTSENTPKSSRGEKCLAKFTSSNGSVFGSLTLDIRKAGDYSQPLPVVVRIAYEGKKAFLRLGENTQWKSGFNSAIMRKREEESNWQNGTS